jgi:sialate O-acetylesterase
MVAAIDCGEFDNIHPLDKQTVGERLADAVLTHTYQKDIDSRYPRLEALHPSGHHLVARLTGADCLVVRNTAAGKELEAKTKSTTESNSLCKGFEVAGEKGLFWPADARIIDELGIQLSSPRVAHPTRARYAWFSWGDISIFGANGMPLTPFDAHI